MNQNDYHELTQQLHSNLDTRSDVIGLIALGSMAGTDRQPDAQSDHDFFVITETGQQQPYRDSTDWIPHPERIVLHFQETDHGCKVVYDDGHLLEYAIFDLEELKLARINSYNVLIDKANLSEIMPTLQQTINTPFDTQRIFDTMICNILVGAMRANRGEIMSAHAFIKHYASRAFMLLCWQQLAPDSPFRDNLDPFRRFEKQFPELGEDLQNLMELPIHEAAISLLASGETILASTMPDSRQELVHTVRAYLAKLENS